MMATIHGGDCASGCDKCAAVCADSGHIDCDVFNALDAAFGTEWGTLSDDQQDAIVRDARDVDDYGEYRRNIGFGNLTGYANVQVGRWARIEAMS
jgi:hypothetical protein